MIDAFPLKWMKFHVFFLYAVFKNHHERLCSFRQMGLSLIVIFSDIMNTFASKADTLHHRLMFIMM